MGGFINLVLSPLESIFAPIIGILKTIGVILNLILEVIKLIPRFFTSISMLASPGKLLKDALYGFKTGLFLIYNAVLDMIFGNMSDKYKHNFNNDNKKEKEDCIKPTFIEVLILILCPPLAIFIRKGMKGILTILVTTILTCFYYFPGVLFASLHIL